MFRDDDKQLNSLNNQRRTVEEYANVHGYTIVGESFDDNVTGMHFDREGIDTFNENDDLMIGFKGLINDSYCRDMSRKIRAGYKQKRKLGIFQMKDL